MSELLKLYPGQRRIMSGGAAPIILRAGRAEIYIRRTETPERQTFLLELSKGSYCFPFAASETRMEIFLLAITECAAQQCSADTPEMRGAMQTWFSALQNTPWIARADDWETARRFWKDGRFLETAASDSLWTVFYEQQSVLGGFVWHHWTEEQRRRSQKVDDWQALCALSHRDAESILQNAGQTPTEADDLCAAGQTADAGSYAVGRAARALGLAPPPPGSTDEGRGALDSLARRAGMSVRAVRLGEAWFRDDCGVLIGFYGAARVPAALLPEGPGHYRLCLPGRTCAVDRETAPPLASDALVCYADLPRRALTPRDILRFAASQCRKEDIAALLAACFILGCLPLLAPIAVETAFGDALPIRDRQGLATIAQILLCAALAAAGLGFMRATAVLRIRTKLETALEAALWSRLLSMPAKFFRRFESGDLVKRMEGISIAASFLTGSFVGGIFHAFFSVWLLGLMLYYHPPLALTAMAFWTLYALTAFFVYRKTPQARRNFVDAANRATSRTLQIVNALPKIRLHGAEEQAYLLWAEAQGRKWRWSLRLQKRRGLMRLIDGMRPFVAGLAIYGVAALQYGDRFGPSSYAKLLGFLTAFFLLDTAIRNMVAHAARGIGALPYLEKLMPLLREAPEHDDACPAAGRLAGRIEVSRVSFAYPGGAEVLRDISFCVEPGESVAIVGRSGCGKSTLVRLLLGFEKPRQGGIYYDGQELEALDAASVRAQMGVVLQNDRLLRGDLYANIAGARPISLEEAWDAARLVGLDADIEAMPMGMHTLIADGGTNLSGGQRQRVLLARSFAHRPRIVLMDEATSALDNRSQSIVAANLKRLGATRIVVAHRISAVQHADRILVMDEGRIAESGTFRDLLQKGGLFAALAAQSGAPK